MLKIAKDRVVALQQLAGPDMAESGTLKKIRQGFFVVYKLVPSCADEVIDNMHLCVCRNVSV
jgi:hypothetical protein